MKPMSDIMAVISNLALLLQNSLANAPLDTNQPGMKFGNTKQMTGTVGEIQKRVWLHFIYPVIDVIYFWIVITICLLKFRSRRETGAGTILALCFSSAFLSWSDGIFCDVTSQKLSDHYGSEHVTPGTAYQLIPHAVGVCEFFAGTCLREAFMASQKFQALRERQRRLYPADNPAQRQSWFRRRRTAQQRSDGGSRELDDLPPAEPGPFAPAAFGTNFQTWSSGSSSASSSQAGEPLDDPRLPRSLSRLAASSDHRRLSETSTAYAPSVRASSVQRSNRSISPIRPTATSLRRAQSLDLQAASQSAGRRMSQLSLR